MQDKARSQKAATQHLRGLESRNRELERKFLDCVRNHRDMKGRLAAAIRAGINSLHVAQPEQVPSTAGHDESVARLSMEMGATLGLVRQNLEALNIAGLPYDI